MDQGGLGPSDIYLTNAVTLPWQPRGKVRLHKKPSASEVAACRPWVDAELALLGPEVVVAMGATAARSLLGPEVLVTRQRGQRLAGPDGRVVVPTVHPSSVLRAAHGGDRVAERARFVDDLRSVARAAGLG